jgi:8-oxo-dGDP phosphatase
VQWTVHGRRTIYDSLWISLDLVDVEQPDGQRYEQHVVRMARPVAATVITRNGKVLLMWRHRHVTDTWGWEIPAGRIEEGETPEQAAVREAVEETGWRPGPLRLLVAAQPSNGSIDTVHYLFHGEAAEYVGPPSDTSEAERIEWIPLTGIRRLVAKGEIVSSPTLTGVLLAGALPTSMAPAGPGATDCRKGSLPRAVPQGEPDAGRRRRSRPGVTSAGGIVTITAQSLTDCRDLIDPHLFDRLTARVMADGEIERKIAEKMVEQALAFLVACARNPGSHLSPSERVDAGWHAFVLHTREYAEFCSRVAGRFIHHRPSVPGEARPAREAIGAAIAAMRAAGLHVDADLWVPKANCSQCYAGCADDPKGA